MSMRIPLVLALAIGATADTAAAQATSAASAQQTAAAAEMAAVAIVQQDTALRLEQERQGAETRLRWLPVLYGVGIFALLALGIAGLAFVWFLLHRARYTLLHPVVELPDGRGGFGAPLHAGQPQRNQVIGNSQTSG